MSDQSIFPEWRSFLGNSSDSETKGFLKSVVKRSGEIAEYDRTKIEAAIGKAIEAEEKRRQDEKAQYQKEKQLQRAILHVHKKYGKNALLKGMNLLEGATMKERNEQVGGHKA